MNERIKELANIWANRRSEDEKLGITYTFSEKALETFAQLIVRECAEIAYNKQYKHSAAHTRGDCAEAIKQHFGVEE